MIVQSYYPWLDEFYIHIRVLMFDTTKQSKIKLMAVKSITWITTQNIKICIRLK